MEVDLERYARIMAELEGAGRRGTRCSRGTGWTRRAGTRWMASGRGASPRRWTSRAAASPRCSWLEPADGRGSRRGEPLPGGALQAGRLIDRGSHPDSAVHARYHAPDEQRVLDARELRGDARRNKI